MSTPTKLKTRDYHNKFVSRVPTLGRGISNKIFKSTRRAKHSERQALEKRAAHLPELSELFQETAFLGN